MTAGERFEGVNAYPLTWPHGRRRTPAADRRAAQFGAVYESTRGLGNGQTYTRRSKKPLTTFGAIERLYAELDRMGVASGNVILSTNVPLRQDGLPRSGSREPDDPGVACYFTMLGVDYVLACDAWDRTAWDRTADNLAAVAKHIEAQRGIARWGVGSLREAFAGFAQLPAEVGQRAHRPWYVVLGIDEPSVRRGDLAAIDDLVERIKVAFRARARVVHPDAGGETAAMLELNSARDAGMKHALGLRAEG